MAVTNPDESFDANFAKLESFKRRNGHTKVPKHYSEDMKLAVWVADTRRQFKLLASAKSEEEKAQFYRDESLTLSPEQVHKLMDLGFEFSNKNPRHMRWEFRFQQLKDFVAQYGHTQVPIGWSENVKLANWVSTQRQEYKNMRKGRTSQLNESRINLLNSIGFAWEVQRGGRRRQLSSGSPVENAPQPKEDRDNTSILPGKALILGVGQGAQDFDPARKKAKTSRLDSGPQYPYDPMQMQQQMQQQVQQQMQQQMNSHWQGYPPSNAQHGIINNALNMSGTPQWHMPQTVMSNGMMPNVVMPNGMMQTHPVQASALHIMFAKSNNRSRTRSDPPSGMTNFGGTMRGMAAQEPRRPRADPPSDRPDISSVGGVFEGDSGEGGVADKSNTLEISGQAPVVGLEVNDNAAQNGSAQDQLVA